MMDAVRRIRTSNFVRPACFGVCLLFLLCELIGCADDGAWPIAAAKEYKIVKRFEGTERCTLAINWFYCTRFAGIISAFTGQFHFIFFEFICDGAHGRVRNVSRCGRLNDSFLWFFEHIFFRSFYPIGAVSAADKIYIHDQRHWHSI